MKQFLHNNWLLVVILLVFTPFYIWGIQYVPFHPDESTQLFMSSDLEALFTKPNVLFWQPDRMNDPRQRLRELDAPITKYLLGFARVVTGQNALSVDWDWTKSWEANLAAGAYPKPILIHTGRLIITLLLPLSLIMIYLIGNRLQGQPTGIIAVVLLGMNAVVLLHGRRAMAEGGLLFGVLLVTLSILSAQRSPWLAGLGMGFAFNAKQSSLALLPVVILALVWLPKGTSNRFKRIAINLILFILVFVLITWALNPVFWSHPVEAVKSAITTRSELAAQQIQDQQSIAPDKEMGSPAQRIFVLLLNLFISPPEYGLIENLRPTQEDVAAYIAIPGHNLFRGIILGGIFIVLTLFGLYVAMRNVVSFKAPQHRVTVLLLMATFFMAWGLLAAIQIYWIRYTIPLIPFVCIWIAYGVASLIRSRSSI